jgi:hypothetical protein
MTVGELQGQLQGMDPKAHVVAHREDRETDEMELFEVMDASLSTGTPTGDELSGRAGFTFERSGSATWLFISIEKA